MKKYFIIDGRNLLCRAAYTFPDLSVRGSWTGAAFGFLSILLKAHRHYGGRCIVVWEGRKNFRKQLFAGYKPPPEDPAVIQMKKDLQRQEKILIEILKLAGVPQYRPVDGEADDAIGTLSRRKLLNSVQCQAGEEKVEVLIYSGDSDIRQLVSPVVTVIAPKPGGVDQAYTPAEVRVKHGVEPWLIPQLKSLMGDASDGIPGIKGIGPKYAAKIVNGEEYPPRFDELLKSCKKEQKLYENLAQIRTDRKLLKVKPIGDKEQLISRMKFYRFRSLVARVDEIMNLARSRT